ncbi:hypothetical protein AB5N19_01609 [Seiridium cardinale]
MPTTEYVRLRPGHPPEFVRSNSFSHRHRHHRRHKCHDDCAGVSWAEYNNVLEQNRNFREQNITLAQEKESLKAEVNKAVSANRAWSEEAARLTAANGRLSGELEILRDENDRLRRSVSSEDDHIKGFKRRIKALERELKDQTRASSAEIGELKESVERSNDVANQWKRKCDEIKSKYDTVKKLLFERDAQLERRNVTIDEQDHTIHRLRELLERYRGW